MFFNGTAFNVGKKMLEETPLKGGTTSDAEDFKQISFNEMDKQYKDLKLYECFHPEIFNRFILFAENPKLQERYQKILDKQKEVAAENENIVGEALKSLMEAKEKNLQQFENNIAKYKKEMEQVMDKCKEFDIEKLKSIYDVHKYNEMVKIDKLFEKRKKEIDTFYEQEISKTSNLYYNQQRFRNNQISEDVSGCENLLAEIFPQENIVSLLILSDILKASELKMACINKITENFSYHQSSESLGSRMMTESIGIILAQLSIQTLKELQQQNDYFFPKSIVDKELEYRKGMLADEYREKTVEELMSMTKGNPLFPDVLLAEIEKRKSKKPFVHLNPERCSPFLIIDEDLLTIHLKGQKRYSCVHATHSRNYEGWAKWYFEVKIEKFDEALGSSISIGWDVDRPSLDGPIIGLTPGYRSQYGYSWQSDGRK